MTMYPIIKRKQFFFAFLFLLFTCNTVLLSQNVTLSSQADVDAFDTSITQVNGDLLIGINGVGISNITDLSNLSSVKSVMGDLSIRQTQNLVNLEGLNNLTSIGDALRIYQNQSLENIDALSNLEEITNVNRQIDIADNDVLRNLDALSKVKNLRNLFIRDNPKIESISGLSGLTFVQRGFLISNNNSLLSLDGLHNITTATIFDLDKVEVRGNDMLQSIEALASLIPLNGSIILVDNQSLTSIDGLEAQTSIGGNVTIQNNASLLNLNGLQNLSSVEGEVIIASNASLSDCCAIQGLLENGDVAIGGDVIILNNPSSCSSVDEVVETNCRFGVVVSTNPPCININNGAIEVFVEEYDTIPFQYEWIRQEDGLTGSGMSTDDVFTIDMLGAGTYDVLVTNPRPDSALLESIVLTASDGLIFEITELSTTNSSNGSSNGSIEIVTSGGDAPYTYTWSGESSGSESGVQENFYRIPNLKFGEYLVNVLDASGNSKVVEVILLDEEVPVVECEKPLDIVILNDVSGSVDAVEYEESKQFFVDFLTEANIGMGANDSRAAIIEWSGRNSQSVKIPITGDLSALQSYVNEGRSFSGNTAPNEALTFGESYLDSEAREDVDKVLVLSTDGSSGQISSSLIALADDFKAQGYHIISIAFDNSFSNSFTRDILRRMASVDALAPGANAYSQLDAELAQQIVSNYLCPINPGSSATAYFNRDGAIEIVGIGDVDDCDAPGIVDVTIEVSAYRELSIPAGTYVNFYQNDPTQSGATSIFSWRIPCSIPIDSSEIYTISVPLDGPSHLFVVLNDDGVQNAPIDFPITSTEEIAYSNNIDDQRICVGQEATLQALKYATSAIPACDTLVTYTINVCNISEIDATDVIVEDVPPVGFALIGTVLNDAGCGASIGDAYDIPAGCCISLSLTYDAAGAQEGYYGDQDVLLGGPSNQVYLDFDGATSSSEDVTIDGTIDCPSTIITFTKSVNIDETCDDRFVEFTFTITNEMNIPLQGLTFEDVLPSPCTWTFQPYAESGLSIGNPVITGNMASFIIDEVQANTVATFSLDANLNTWSGDGVLSNTASLENVPDLTNGGFKTLTSNTTSTMVTASPAISTPDTIVVSQSSDTISLEVINPSFAEITWTTNGTGEFTIDDNSNSAYIPSEEDSEKGEVTVFLTASSECGETGSSTLLIFEDCTVGDDVSIELDAIDLSCDAVETEIFLSSTIEFDSVSWSGADFDLLEGGNVMVSMPGIYTVTGYYGVCTVTESIEITQTLFELMESYSICEGESIEINGEIYSTEGMYEFLISSETDCDTLLALDLEVLENSMAEETFFLTSGVVVINEVIYDQVGQYSQELTSANGCDSLLILNILSDDPLISFDFDDCTAFLQTMSNTDYSEFVPFYHSSLDCGSVTASNFYRDLPTENPHSCTEGLNDSYSMCVGSEPSCDFEENSGKMIKLNLTVEPNLDGEVVLNRIEFYQQAPENFRWIYGEEGINNYPLKYGIRILHNGEVIYSELDLPTSTTWQTEQFSFSNNENFRFTENAELEVQLLPYCPVGNSSVVTAWDLEDFRIFGSCSTANDMLVVAGNVLPYTGEVVQEVEVTISNNEESNNIITDQEGDFAFVEARSDKHIMLSAYKDSDHLKGVSTLDLILIQRHLLGLSGFDNPLQFIAADINHDGKVSVLDLIDLKYMILGVHEEFPSNTSYRFLDAKGVSSSIVNPWEISEEIHFPFLSDDILNADFVSVKVGDVSDSGNSSGQNTTVSKDDFSLTVVNDGTHKSGHKTFDFYLSESIMLEGMQFSIDLNGEELLEIKSDFKGFGSENYFVTENGILNITWSDTQTTFKKKHLFTVFLDDNDEESTFNIKSAEVYADEKAYPILEIKNGEKNEKALISDLNVYPNPINSKSTISFKSSKDSEILLTIQTVEGKGVYEEKIKVEYGDNHFPFPFDSALRKSGVLMIRITDVGQSLVKKVIVVE